MPIRRSSTRFGSSFTVRFIGYNFMGQLRVFPAMRRVLWSSPIFLNPPSAGFLCPLTTPRRRHRIIVIMATSRDLHPLTHDQAVQLRHDLTLVEERLQDIAILMRICYGEESQAVIRADETSNALQRLKWELERMQVRKKAAGSGASLA